MMRRTPLPLAAAVLAAAGAAAPARERDLRGALHFGDRSLVSVSDADMVASAYVDGDLGPREGADALSVISLAGDPRDWRAAEVEVSNSVAGPPASVDVTPDGRFAIVIETCRTAALGGHVAACDACGLQLLQEPPLPEVPG